MVHQAPQPSGRGAKEEASDMSQPAHPIPGVVYAPPAVVDGYRQAGVLTPETLVGALADIAARFPDRIAISENGDDGITHAALDRLTDRAAAGLLGLGLQPLDRVLFQVGNCRDLLVAFLACLKAGLIPICTLAAHRRHEIGIIGRQAGARAHIVQGDDPKFDFVGFSSQMRGEIDTLAHTIVLHPRPDLDLAPGTHRFDDLVDAATPDAARAVLAAIPRDPWQVALFQLSGGTSGVPKIIPRFHSEYLHTIRSIVRWHGLDETTVGFTPNPLMHNAPMACYWGPPLFSGGEVAVSTGLDVAVIERILTRRRPDWLAIPLVILLRLKDAGTFERIDLSYARGFSLPNSALRVEQLTGAPARPLFGMTEGLLSYGRRGDPRAVIEGTVGRPVSDHDDVRILHPESEEECAEGEIGELAVRGPSTIHGYFDAPEHNATAFTSDGFYRSGDLMRFTRIEGVRYLVFEGRVKDVVSRGGEKVNCQEVERLAIGHPDIGSISIVPMPDPVYGERACAFVIPARGAAPMTVGALGAWLEQAGMAKFKWPERVEVVSEFPMTSSGKVSKPLLRAQIAARLKEEAAAAAR